MNGVWLAAACHGRGGGILLYSMSGVKLHGRRYDNGIRQQCAKSEWQRMSYIADIQWAGYRVAWVEI